MGSVEHNAAAPAVGVIASWDGISLLCYAEGSVIQDEPLEREQPDNEQSEDKLTEDESLASEQPESEQSIESTSEEHTPPLPELPEEVALLTRIYWPLELFLVRTFSLPLTETRLLDADILSQELAESSGEDSGDWWLTWHAEKSDEGVAGMVFGLPKHLQQAMEESPVWQDCPQLVVDGWERLSALRAGRESCAIIDEDADGVFFGLLQSGVWRCLRRVNRTVAVGSVLSDEEVAQQIRQSWGASGFEMDHEVVGQSGQGLHDALILDEYSNWQVQILDALPERHSANFAIDVGEPAGLNIRHSKWRPERSWQLLKPWKRPLTMAAGVLLIWLAVITVNIYSLEADVEAYRADIEASFHRGLPDERVMLDPLAQLKKAGGTSGQEEESRLFLEQLEAVSEVHQKFAWQLREMSLRGGKMQISGSAKDIDSLNQMRDLLQSRSGREVVIADTDLSEDRVTFRMKW